MKNIGIKTKKFVRKITAIASAALMAGLSMGAAAADLSSLTSTFITSGEFKAYVVVGTGGASNVVGFAKDVAGSIVVASAFAQQAKTSTASSGTAVLSRNLTSGYVGTDGTLNISEVVSPDKVWTNSVTGFSWLPNSTVVNTTGNAVANVTGVLTVKANLFSLDTDGSYILTNGGIVYNITFNSNLGTTGNKGVGNYTSGIPFPDGKSYQITNWTGSGSNVNVSLGDYTVVKGVGMGQAVTLGSSGVTYVYNGIDTSSSTKKLQTLIVDSNGNKLVDTVSWATGDYYENDTLGITVRLKEWKEVSNIPNATIEWSTSSTKLVNSEVNSKWPNWTIYLTNDSIGITSIAWQYRQQTPVNYIKIAAGTSVSMLDGLFKIIGEPLVINSTNQKSATITINDAIGSAADVAFVDVNNTSHSIDLNLKSDRFGINNQSTISNWLDTSWLLLCWDQGTSFNINLTNTGVTPAVTVVLDNGTPYTLNKTLGNITGYQPTINVTFAGAARCSSADWNATLVNFTSNAGNPLNASLKYVYTNASSGSINGTITLTEPGTSASITFTYVNGDIDSSSVKVSGLTQISSTGDMYYTKNWGTLLSRDSSTKFSIVLPEERRIGKAAFGQTGDKTYNLTANSYNSELDVTLKSSAGTSETVKAIDVGLAMLDSEVTTTTLDRPVVLVGGSAVNTLVKSLVDAGSVNMSVLSANRALVQLVDNAFNSKSALVIAGWAGEDTRLAAQVVASQVLGNNMGLSGSSKVLNTGVTSYRNVTVV